MNTTEFNPIAKMQELRTKAEGLATAINTAMLESRLPDADKARTELDELIAEYAAIAQKVCFNELKEAKKPMIEAARRLTYPTIRAKETPIEGTKTKKLEIDDAEKTIDPLRLDKYCGGIGEAADWHHRLMKFNYLMTAQKAHDLGISPSAIADTYAMSDIAKKIDMGKNPTSKTQILKTLTALVSAMIGAEFKPTSHDVNFLLSIYSKKSRKALTVVCSNHRYMRQYMLEICHRLVTGKSYGIEYKAAK